MYCKSNFDKNKKKKKQNRVNFDVVNSSEFVDKLPAN